jgi:hypothetical protein
MVTVPRSTSRLLAAPQARLLMLLVLLGHFGVLVLCSRAMGMDAPPQAHQGLEIASIDMGAATAPLICPIGTGDCMLGWTSPVSLVRAPDALLSLAVLGHVWLGLEAHAPLELATHALDPPNGVDPQALLQVFRL